MTGVDIVAMRSTANLPRTIDTLLVAGGDGVGDACRDQTLIKWIASTAKRARRVGSVCNGALLLAATGLLNGRTATTHWSDCDELEEKYPAVNVEPDRIYVQDGNVYTSAGVTAGMDLALMLVEEDWGQDIALLVARRLVLFLRRPGGQSQFSQHLVAERGSDRVRTIQRYIFNQPMADLSVSALAERCAMSARNFARVFVKEMGTTPAKFVEQARLDAARTKLELSHLSVETIASECGFGYSEIMRRAFARTLGVSPRGYRERFRTSSVEKSRQQTSIT